MRMALAAALFAMAFLSGCQEPPEVYHVLPAFQRGPLAKPSPEAGAADRALTTPTPGLRP